MPSIKSAVSEIEHSTAGYTEFSNRITVQVQFNEIILIVFPTRIKKNIIMTTKKFQIYLTDIRS